MAGRYDEKVFEIWNTKGISEAVQYYLFEKIHKKLNYKFYSIEIKMLWEEGFSRYFIKQTNSNSIKHFRYLLEKEKSKQIYDFGNKDCIDTMYFTMDKRY